ncbi:hypothetical protein [Streptomyces sp. YS-3]|uniref:hypothetical protein n=1 Tax=Streptomyces sp. YS-3 TaxID=3381352 RepID=UPI003862A7F6
MNLSIAKDEPAPNEVAGWLNRNALRLNSLTAGTPTIDLRTLKSVLDGVRVVGLEEAPQGTREFFQLKNRPVEFLMVPSLRRYLWQGKR